jgi:hypothetical protein
VLIAPMLIGVPVAAEPGFVPHDEVLVLVLLVVLEPVEVDAAGVVVVELLPQPARTTAPATAVSVRSSRTRGTCWNILTYLLLRR